MGVTAAEASRAFSRRALLKGGLSSLALLAVSGGALALQRTRLRPAPEGGLRRLTLAEYSILSAIAARLVPPASSGVPGAEGIDVALLADRLLEHAHDDAVDGLRLGLTVIESGLTGALFLERVRPFTQLDAAGQQRALSCFRTSSVPLRRTLYAAFSGLAGSLYYGEPRSWPSIGYPGPPSPQALRASYAAQLVDFDPLRQKP